jgi:sugar-specific transcriptional regulator TrmB
MVLIDVALKELMGIGLTETEAKVYIASFGGASDAKRLSETARVPYSKIHTLLRGLEKKGLVNEKRGRPTLYVASEPREALEKYQKRRIEDLAKSIERAEQALKEVAMVGETEKPDIWIIKGQEEILRKAYEALNGAKKEVKFALPVVPELALVAFLPILTRLHADKVSVKFLLSNGIDSEIFRKLGELADVRVRDKMFGGGLIVDDREAVIVVGSEGADLSLAIWSSHSGLVELAKTYFDYLW